VFFYTPVFDTQRRIVCETLTLICTMQFYRPSIRPLVTVIGHITPNLPLRLTEVSLLLKLPPKSI
jgi:hypothetical protein